VIAVELDGRMVEILSQTLGDRSNVEIVQGDILKLDPAELVEGARYTVVANLPYYITSALLRHLLEATVKPHRIVVTVQREVAERLVARPGQMSLLSVSVQFYGHPRLVARIPARAFYPAPKVNSAVVRIDLYERPPVEVEDVDRFFEIVRAGFAQRRKQLRNSLARGLGMEPNVVAEALSRCAIDPTRRAQTLSVEEWGKVYREFVKREG
jgi:16S rRNA (adenine1518-N6/adenine1519-N6)-dimethyltransferase